MKHPVHQKIKSLIAIAGKSREEIAEKLDMTTRTLIRRLENGMWTLPEIITLEEIFDTPILPTGDKNFNSHSEDGLHEMSHTFSPRPHYRLKVEIDPDNFNAQDLEELNRDLTERLLAKYKAKNGDKLPE